MKKKWMLKATACTLTVSMLLTTIVSGHELDEPAPLARSVGRGGNTGQPEGRRVFA